MRISSSSHRPEERVRMYIPCSAQSIKSIKNSRGCGSCTRCSVDEPSVAILPRSLSGKYAATSFFSLGTRATIATRDMVFTMSGNPGWDGPGLLPVQFCRPMLLGLPEAIQSLLRLFHRLVERDEGDLDGSGFAAVVAAAEVVEDHLREPGAHDVELVDTIVESPGSEDNKHIPPNPHTLCSPLLGFFV